MRDVTVNRSASATITPLLVAGTGAAILLVAVATITKADSDLWGHLRFGLDTLASWTLPSIDPYSFTQDRPWVNHEWLSELMMGAAYAAAGVSGLAILKAALVTGALSIAWQGLHRLRPDVRIVTMAAIALGTVPVTRTLRPQLWTLLALAILCSALLASDTRWRRWLPVLFVLWANSHGGWIVGLGILAVWTAIDVAVNRRLHLEAATTFAGCAAATLITPYGWNLWVFLASTVSLSGRAITEWQPLWNSPPADAGPWIAAVLAGLFLARTAPTHRHQILGTLAMLAYSSVRIVRIVPLFVLCSAILLSGALAARWPRRDGAAPPAARGEWPLAFVLVVGLLAGAAWVLASSLRCVAVEGDWIADAAAVRRLQGANAGRLVTFFDWGQYALWHLSPTLKVSMDGRRETVYSDARLDEHGAILNGTPQGLAVLDQWSPEYVWLPTTSTTTRLWLVERGYRLEHDTARSFVAVRGDLPRLPAPSASETSEASACFPG